MADGKKSLCPGRSGILVTWIGISSCLLTSFQFIVAPSVGPGLTSKCSTIRGHLSRCWLKTGLSSNSSGCWWWVHFDDGVYKLDALLQSSSAEGLHRSSKSTRHVPHSGQEGSVFSGHIVNLKCSWSKIQFYNGNRPRKVAWKVTPENFVKRNKCDKKSAMIKKIAIQKGFQQKS